MCLGRSALGLFCCSPPYILKQDVSLNSDLLFELGWLASELLELTCLPAECWGYRHHTWVLGTQTQVLTLPQQILYPLSPLSRLTAYLKV